MSKAPIRFPLTAGDISLFSHPSPHSPLHAPHLINGLLYAGSGHLAIRAAPGQWHESDFTPPPEEFTIRITSLPWEHTPPQDGEWMPLDHIRGDLYSSAPIGIWTQKHTPAPSPLWHVGGMHTVRLSHLQLLARLPRSEVYLGRVPSRAPLYIRFNPGLALIPYNERLHQLPASRHIFRPRHNPLTGHRIEYRKDRKHLDIPSHLKNWPPPQPNDD